MYEMRTSGIMHLSPIPTPAIVPLFRNDGDAMEVDGGGGGASSPLPAHPGSGNTHYELPDGTVVDLATTQTGRDLCRLPELWFADTTPCLDGGGGHDDNHNLIYKEHATLSAAPLHRLVHESLSAVADIDVRKDLASQIILTGSGSLTPHLDRRLSYELAKLCKSRVIYNKHHIERQCAAWIGGSILTSLGSFQQLWLSRAEYEEYGAYLAAQRFPLS
jgi:actin-like protein 6A